MFDILFGNQTVNGAIEIIDNSRKSINISAPF